MKGIETEFHFAGHLLRQIWRENDVAVYERSRPDKAPHELELVIIKVDPEKTMPNGLVTPEHETYPRASKWGSIGWSFPIRHKEWVLSLGKKLLQVTESRASFVRQATSEFKALR